MRVFREEVRKLVLAPMVVAFTVMSIVFNVFLMATSEPVRPLFNSASSATQELGQHADAMFVDGLAVRAGFDPAVDGEEQVTAAAEDTLMAGEPLGDETQLLLAAYGMENVFEGYDMAALAAHYSGKVAASPAAAALIEDKYALLEGRVEHLARTGAAMDFYAGPATYDAHGLLFGTLVPAAVAEGALVAMLGAVHLLGCEQQARTAAVVYASRVGRRLVCVKTAAALTVGVACYALVVAVTLAILTARWDFAGVWDASVSSQFNVIVEGMVARPFVTWVDFTVVQYLAASLALGVLLVLACGIAASIAGVLAGNAYRAALGLAAVLVGAFTASQLLPSAGWWVTSSLLDLLVVRVWARARLWFTDGGAWTLVPWQDVAAPLLGIVLFGALFALVVRMRERKDLRL